MQTQIDALKAAALANDEHAAGLAIIEVASAALLLFERAVVALETLALTVDSSYDLPAMRKREF